MIAYTKDLLSFYDYDGERPIHKGSHRSVFETADQPGFIIKIGKPKRSIGEVVDIYKN